MMKLALAFALLAACGRIDFDPLGATGDGHGMGDDGNGSGSSVCSPTTTTCFSSMLSLFMGSTGNASNDIGMYTDNVHGTCGGTGGGQYGVGFTVIQAGMYRFSVTSSIDTVLYIIDGTTCTGPDIACTDLPGTSGEQIDISLALDQQIIVVVDSNGPCGNVMLSYRALF